MRRRWLGVVASGLLAVACGGPAPAAKGPEAVTATSATAASATPAPAPTTPPVTSLVASDAPASSAAPTEAVKPPKKSDAPPSKISARHVLIQWMGCEHAPPSVVRTREQAYTVAQEVLRRAKAGEDFARLAVEFSDEPNAGQRGGSLGRFGHGQMVKAFEEAAFALQPGELSGIVETGFGYHVIQRTE